MYFNGFIRLKGLGEDFPNDFKFGTSTVLGPYLYASQTQSPDDSVHPTIDSLHIEVVPNISFSLPRLTGGFKHKDTILIKAEWSINLDSVGDYQSSWDVQQEIEVLKNISLNHLNPVGKVLGVAGLSSMWVDSLTFDANIFRISDSVGTIVDSIFPDSLWPPDTSYTETDPIRVPKFGDVEMAKTYPDTHNYKSPSVKIFGVSQVGIDEMSRTLPLYFSVLQNRPNPFIGITVIEYGLSKDTNVKITMYNLSGQKVTTLVKENKKAGYHMVRWDGKDNSGKNVASGIYFYRLEAGDYTATKKLYFIRWLK